MSLIVVRGRGRLKVERTFTNYAVEGRLDWLDCRTSYRESFVSDS